jgi:hypothetical protein
VRGGWLLFGVALGIAVLIALLVLLTQPRLVDGFVEPPSTTTSRN